MHKKPLCMLQVKINFIVWTGLFTIVSIYKYYQNNLVFSFLSYLIR